MRIAGLRVVDATKKLVLHIIPVDINKGKTKDPGACAAARACTREIPACSEARVHLGRTYIKMSDKWVRFQTPRSLRGEIIAFDRGAEFFPGKYTLSPVNHPLGKAQGSIKNKNSPKNKQKKRAAPHQVRGVRPHGANR